MQDQSPRRPGRLVRVARIVSPNLPALALAVGGVATELVMLGRVRDSIYRTEGLTPWVAVTFLAWFWYSASWAIWAGSSAVAGWWRRQRGWVAGIAYGLWIALLAMLAGVYLASWEFYLQSNQFLSWEALRFTAHNLRLLWLYVRQTENAALAAWIVLAVAAVGGLLGMVRWMAASRWPIESARTTRRRRRIVWYGLTVLVLASLGASESRRSLTVINRRVDALRHGLHPAVTLAADWLDSMTVEAIEPWLDPAQLHPLAETGWSPLPRPARRLNVVIVTVESLRHDVVQQRQQGREVTPQLNRLAREGMHLRHAYAAAPFTSYSTAGLFASLYPLWSRRPVYFHPADPWPKACIYDLLKPLGYATAIISSQNESWGGMDHFLKSPNLDSFQDPRRSPAPDRTVPDRAGAGPLPEPTSWADNLPDAQTADRAIAWVRQQAAGNTPFFLAVNFQSPHFPYHLPAGAEQVFAPSTIDFPVSFLGYPVDKTAVMRNAYLNTVYEADRQLGRLVDALRENGQWTNTILVVCGDHGQAFHEKAGYVAHGREPIESVIRTACVLSAPGLVPPAMEDYPVELIDVVPTVFALLKLPPHPNFQGIDFLAVTRPPLEHRLLFFHSEQPLSHTDALLLAGRWKYACDLVTKQESLYDLRADPDEQDDVLGQQRALAQRLRDTLFAWRRRQLAYYAYPAYYQHFYPPSPPAWK